MALGQKPHRKLIEATPNVYLVGIMVSGGVLSRFQLGNVCKRIGRAATGSCIQTVVATIGFDAVEPDQPGTYHILDLRDFAGRKRWLRGVGVGADPVAIGRGEGGSLRIAVDGDIEVLLMVVPSGAE